MSGPTREEVEAAVKGAMQEAWNCDISDRLCKCDEGVVCDHCQPRILHEALEAAEPLLRARHVREAVEGLSDTVIARDLSPCAPPHDVDGPQWWFNDPAAFRAALLAALTGEGK